MEREVTELSHKTEKMLTNALIIGGSLALTYLVVRSFSGSKKKRNKTKAKSEGTSADLTGVEETDEEESVGPTLLSKVGTHLLNQATFILLEMAKDKLAEYLVSRKKSDENS